MDTHTHVTGKHERTDPPVLDHNCRNCNEPTAWCQCPA